MSEKRYESAAVSDLNGGSRSIDPPVGHFIGYQLEMWTVEKDVIYGAIPALTTGIEYAKQCLADHEEICGRRTLKDRSWAETMEDDIRKMECALDDLRRLPNVRDHRCSPEASVTTKGNIENGN
jgi:hypothetical protein